MKTVAALCCLACLVAFAVVPAAVAADAPPSPSPAGAPLPDVWAPLRMEAGTWDVDVTFLDPNTQQPTGTAKGTQVNTLLANGHWITNDLRVEGDPVFVGHGVWGWDPVAKEYVDAWVDSNDGSPRIDHGFWNAEQNTMYWTAAQPDGNGHLVTYRMTEVFKGDERTLAFFQIALQSGRLVPLAEMRFHRRLPSASAGP